MARILQVGFRMGCDLSLKNNFSRIVQKGSTWTGENYFYFHNAVSEWNMINFADVKVAFKIIVLGNCGVGKTSLINFFSCRTHEIPITNIGVCFAVRNIKIRNLSIVLELWDTGKSLKFKVNFRVQRVKRDTAVLPQCISEEKMVVYSCTI